MSLFPNKVLHTGSGGLPADSSGKEPACRCKRRKKHGFTHWVGKIPLEEGMATHSSSLAWRLPCLVSYGAWGCKSPQTHDLATKPALPQSNIFLIIFIFLLSLSWERRSNGAWRSQQPTHRCFVQRPHTCAPSSGDLFSGTPCFRCNRQVAGSCGRSQPTMRATLRHFGSTVKMRLKYKTAMKPPLVPSKCVATDPWW